MRAYDLTVDEATKVIGVARATIYLYVRNGKIPYRKEPTTNTDNFNRRWRYMFNKEEIEEWAEEWRENKANHHSTAAIRRDAKLKKKAKKEKSEKWKVIRPDSSIAFVGPQAQCFPVRDMEERVGNICTIEKVGTTNKNGAHWPQSKGHGDRYKIPRGVPRDMRNMLGLK